MATLLHQTRIPCVLMRGGTSKGPCFLAKDLPSDPIVRDQVLLRLMGSPDNRQIDGIGGADSLTSKVVIVSPSQRPDADVDYLFAQVVVDSAVVDTGPTCGNMLAAVGPFAIEQGLIPAADPETVVRIYMVNVNALVEAVISTPGGIVQYDGDTAIDGVPGTAAPVKLAFVGAVGGKTGHLFPTGQPRDVIDGIEVSCLDVAMPTVIARAADFGKTGYESKKELDADKDFFVRMEAIRRKASLLMGLGDATDKVIPKFAIIAPPTEGQGVTARYFVPQNTHGAMAVTGGTCIAACAAIPGTVADGISVLPQGAEQVVIPVEHPSGKIDIDISMTHGGTYPDIKRAASLRTTRRLFEGNVLVPSTIWSPG